MFLGPLLERDSKVIMFNVFVYVLLTFFSIANSVNLFFASKKEEFFYFFFPFFRLVIKKGLFIMSWMYFHLLVKNASSKWQQWLLKD